MTDPRSPTLTLRPDVPTTFTLGQPWREVPDPGLRSTVVQVTFRESALYVTAELEDDDVFNSAIEHNSATWETGDVFEIFARRDDEEAYVEVHVTPDNVKLYLLFDDFGHAARLRHMHDIAGDPDRIASRAERTGDGWRAAVRVPLDAAPGDLVRLSFCRYDATRGSSELVLSSSAAHPVCSFHRPLEWTLCRIAD